MKCEKILRIYILMCVSLPFSYIGILGTQQFQMISWYNIYIVLYGDIVYLFTTSI